MRTVTAEWLITVEYQVPDDDLTVDTLYELGLQGGDITAEELGEWSYSWE